MCKSHFNNPVRMLPLMIMLLLAAGIELLAQDHKKPYVVVLSMDGFRWDYTEIAETPNFDKIAANGVKATSLIPAFPTKTFPNHYSIATGLYPDHHGIVQNSFFDRETGRYYSMMDRGQVEDGSFYGGEPIWVTAEKQGVTTGCYFWVGSEAEIDGYRPTYWKKYDHGLPYSQRIDSVAAWLQKPEETRPHLIMFYFDEPDQSGHRIGPGSQEMPAVISRLDSLLGVLIGKLEMLSIYDQINLIVLSDHGMQPVTDNKKIILNHHLEPHWMEELQGYNPNFLIGAAPGFSDSILLSLQKLQGLHIWKSDEVPERLHYGSHPRILDFVVVADSGWSIVSTPDQQVSRGAHGYDNSNPNMHGIFYAMGPAFKKKYRAQSFGVIDIYPLLCHLLHLRPARADGELPAVEHMLAPQE